MRVNKKVILMFAIGMLLGMVISTPASAQIDKYKAIFITKFIKNMEFPEKKAKYTVGVMGNSPVLLELEKIKGVNNLNVIKLSGMDQLTDCDVIFLPEAQHRNFEVIKQNIEGKSVIIISDTEELVSQGAQIGFYAENEKLRFTINKEAMDTKNVKVSRSLLGIAKVYNN